MRHATTLLVVLLTITPLASATAQVRPGERVRVTHLPICSADVCVGPRRQIVGTLMSVSGDSLLLSVDGGAGPVFLPLISVSRMQVLRGRKPAMGRGAAIGALAGGVIGLVGSLTTYKECEGFCPLDFGRGGTAALSGLVFGGLGAGVGYLDGRIDPTGMMADLVLLDANPLEDIRNTTRIGGVVVSGTYYDRQGLDDLLESVASAPHNSAKKFWTRINSYPASRPGTLSKRMGDPRLVEAVGDSHQRSLAQSFAVALV